MKDRTFYGKDGHNFSNILKNHYAVDPVNNNDSGFVKVLQDLRDETKYPKTPKNTKKSKKISK